MSSSPQPTSKSTLRKGTSTPSRCTAVGEIHLGGHDHDADDHGAPLLIDSHAAEVVDPVWQLLDHTLAQSGPKPLLVEWDTDVPDWPVLAAEARRADAALNRVLA